MLVRGKAAHLIGAEGETPPLPHIEVSDAEGKRLIGMGIAEEVKPNKPGKQTPAPKTPEPTKQPETDEGAGNGGQGGDNGEGNTERAETILQALDLVEDAQRETEGERAGKPTVAAIAEITGLADVTAEEIDAAIAAHAAA